MCLCWPFTPLATMMRDQTLTLLLDHMPEFSKRHGISYVYTQPFTDEKRSLKKKRKIEKKKKLLKLAVKWFSLMAVEKSFGLLERQKKKLY